MTNSSSNTKGVEDGITGEHAISGVSSCGSPDPDLRSATARCICGKEYSFWGEGSLKAAYDSINAHVHSNLLLRSATPEELTAQAESRGENYKPGPRQATPFMPEARVTSMANVSSGEAFSYMVGGPLLNSQPPSASPTLPVPERTKILMEALKAVENERLDEIYIHGEDAAYSRAIRDAESAIKQLLEDKSKPVATTSARESRQDG